MNNEFWLSHHPKCENFKNHTFSLFGSKFCIGCFIGYPSAILGLIVATQLIEISEKYSELVFWMGIGFTLSILLSFTSLTEIKSIKMAQKIFMGFGSGCFLTYLFYIPGVPTVLKWVTVIFTAFTLNLVMNVVHYRSHNKVCDECQFQPHQEGCNGYN